MKPANRFHISSSDIVPPIFYLKAPCGLISMSSELELSNEFASIGVSGFAGGALAREKGRSMPPGKVCTRLGS